MRRSVVNKEGEVIRLLRAINGTRPTSALPKLLTSPQVGPPSPLLQLGRSSINAVTGRPSCTRQILESLQPPTTCFIVSFCVQSPNGISQYVVKMNRRRISRSERPYSALRSKGFRGVSVPAKVPLTPATWPL